MKNVKDIPYFKNIREVWEFEFGVFYFFDQLVISEIKEGVVFQWPMAKKAVEVAKKRYGEDGVIAYISNRVNTYSVAPTDWLKFYINRAQIAYFCTVGSTKGSLPNKFLEQIFFKDSLRQFNDLEEAIAWALGRIEQHSTQNMH
ncbi:hypothetical protein [Maribacter sp. 2307ULW6-5]|uniref:hypothetical protein n=1 Tax=Maribacter sp. 2307ULW6-5 TaxID=3386275 RepID=UPI0039BCCFB2